MGGTDEIDTDGSPQTETTELSSTTEPNTNQEEKEPSIKFDPNQIVEALRKDQIFEVVPIDDSSEADPTTQDPALRPTHLKKRNPICEICEQNPHKYTCPACATRSCSLECVRKHKIDTSCTGKRVPQYIPINQMTSDDLRHDFFFIKEGERLAGESFRVSSRQSKKLKRQQMVGKSISDAAAANKSEEGGPEDDIESRSWSTHTVLPMALKKLVTEAQSRGVTLRLMPRGMTRRRQNTTFYAYKTQKFFWRIEWVFNSHEGVDKQIKISEERVDDGTNLHEALRNLINSLSASTNEAPDSEFFPSQRKTLRERLAEYLNIPTERYLVLLQILHTPANQPQFQKLNMNLTIAQNLVGKTLLEFPTFYVVPPSHKDTFQFVEDPSSSSHIPGSSSHYGVSSYNNSLIAAALQKDVSSTHEVNVDGEPVPTTEETPLESISK